MKKSKITALILALMFIFFSVFGCTPKKQNIDPESMTGSAPISASMLALDTVIMVTLYNESERPIIDEMGELINKYDLVFSRTNENSELYKLNKNGGGTMSDDMRDIISLAVKISEESKGLFDITVAPLVELWDFKSGNGKVPDKGLIEEKLKLVGYKNISVEGNELSLKNGATIDLGGIAKGYIADKLKAFLLERNVKSAILDLGGNISVIGSKPDGDEYSVGIARPFAENADETIKILKLRDTSAVTSGSYQRYFYEGDKLYHHILDPRTGYGADSGLFSVTIIAGNSAKADALSTACFVMGIEGAKELISAEKVKAIFVTTDYSVIEYGE
ncbi:MAG: FAD:protein FMN transferase [Clostridia bacterium]